MTRDEARSLVLRRLKQYCPAVPDIIPDTIPLSEFTDRMGLTRTWLFLSDSFELPMRYAPGMVTAAIEHHSDARTVGDLIALVAEIETISERERYLDEAIDETLK